KRLELEKKTQFVGAVSHDRVPEYIAAADACVAPFTAERNQTLGVSALKMFEYLACGRPVVATSVPGVADLLAEFGCGISVRPDEPSELAGAIEKVVSDPSF